MKYVDGGRCGLEVGMGMGVEVDVDVEASVSGVSIVIKYVTVVRKVCWSMRVVRG
jgi:hypothetical protein